MLAQKSAEMDMQYKDTVFILSNTTESKEIWKQTSQFQVSITTCDNPENEMKNLFKENKGLTFIVISCHTVHSTIKLLRKLEMNNGLKIVIYGKPEVMLKVLDELTHINQLIVIERSRKKCFIIFKFYRPTLFSKWKSSVVLKICGQIHFNDIAISIKNITNLFSESSVSDFGGQNLRVTGVLDPTYAYDTNIEKVSNKTYEFRDSFAVEILRALEVSMGFKSVPVVTNAWGHLNMDSVWQGMISLLLKKEADLAISSTADRPFRRNAVTFNMPTNEIRLTSFFKRPLSSTTSNALLAPFQTEFWIAVLLWILVASTSLCLFKAASTILDCQKEDDYSGCNWAWSYLDCIQWPFSSMSLQGFYDIPSTISVRIVVLTGLVNGLIMYAAYAGTLISFLSVVVEPITNLGQLVATDYVFSIISDPLASKFLEESPSINDKLIFKRRRLDPIYKSMNDAKKELNKGKFVFLCDHISGYGTLSTDFTNEESCQIRDIAIPNGQQKQGTMVNKDCIFKRVIDYQVHEYGLIKRWTTQYLQRRPLCEPMQVFEEVKIDSVLLAFKLILFLGLVSISILIAEIVVSAKLRVEGELSTFGLLLYFNYILLSVTKTDRKLRTLQW